MGPYDTEGNPGHPGVKGGPYHKSTKKGGPYPTKKVEEVKEVEQVEVMEDYKKLAGFKEEENDDGNEEEED